MTKPKSNEKTHSESYREFALKAQKETTTAHLLQLAMPKLKVQPSAFDADPWRFNCPNGTLNLRTGLLHPHEPKDLITKIAGCDYSAGAKAPLWDSFLYRVLGGSEPLISFIQKAVGYSLTGLTSEQCFFILYGLGANGKSTFTGTVIKVLGRYGGTVPSSLFTAQKFEQHPTVLADLFQVRMAVSNEVKSGTAWDEERLKSLTGGDKIKARRMAENFWEFDATHKLWLCVNHAPITKDNSEGFWRRIRMIPFTATIPKDQRDPKLMEKLMEELPGILAWAVRGCLLWQQEGLGLPDEVKEATDDYRGHQDPFKRFLDECTERPGPGDGTSQVKATVLQTAQHQWASQNAEQQLSLKELKAAAEEHGIFSKTSNGVQYRGIRLRRG